MLLLCPWQAGHDSMPLPSLVLGTRFFWRYELFSGAQPRRRAT